MNYFYWLSQIKSTEQSLVGNKLYVLSQLLQEGCSIMPGFVLANNLPRELWQNLDDSGSLIGNLPDSSLHLDVNNYQVLQSVAQQSRRIINQASLSAELIAKVFQAAQQLNCQTLILHPYIAIPYQQYQGNNSLWRSHTCRLQPEALAAAIKRVWGELFTARSLLYWQKLGLAIEKVNLAVLVQPLKNHPVSGIVEIDREIIRLRSTWGLSQSLLWGEVNPDTHIIHRQTKDVLKRQLGSKSYGYRLRGNDELKLGNCLESYIPPLTQSQTFTLDDTAIAELLELTEAVLQKQPLLRYLEWSLVPRAIQVSTKQQFYFSQLDYQTTTPINSVNLTAKANKSPIQPIITGLAASPGQILADIVVAADLDLSETTITPGCILVIEQLPGDRIALLKQVGGIISQSGGITSHAAIVARELKIPAIVNALDASKILSTGMTVFLDGDEGKVYSSKDSSKLAVLNTSAATTDYPIATKLMVNLSQPEAISDAASLPVDGVGLLRSELMLSELLTTKSLAEWQQETSQKQFLHTLKDLLQQFVAAFAPRPVFYRSIDWYAQDTVGNSMVGNRGTYNYLIDSTLFDLELMAINSVVSNGGKLNLILPFVRSVEEFKFCRRRIENIGLTTKNFFQLWIMAEVPSVIFLLPAYIRAGVQGIAIGTNDLTQLLLAVDREEHQFSVHGLDANHPAMHQAIAQLIATAKANHLPCSLCGQAPVQYPSLIDKLIEWGITSISVEPEAVLATYKAIARAEKRLLLKQ